MQISVRIEGEEGEEEQEEGEGDAVWNCGEIRILSEGNCRWSDKYGGV